MRVWILQADNRPKLDYLQKTRAINQRVCDAMGYQYQFVEMDNQLHSHLHPAAKKIVVVQEFLDTQHDQEDVFLVFLDSDAWVHDASALHTLLHHLAQDPHTLGAFSRDPYVRKNTYVNSGSFILKINDATRRMYDEIRASLETVRMFQKQWPFDQFYVSNYVYTHRDAFLVFVPDVLNTPIGRILRHNWLKNAQMHRDLDDALQRRPEEGLTWDHPQIHALLDNEPYPNPNLHGYEYFVHRGTVASPCHFITFGAPSPAFHKRASELARQASSWGMFTTVQAFTDADLKKDRLFWPKHGPFVEHHLRGYGYWIWKPYLIYRTLEQLQDGEILVYADAGCTLNAQGISRFQEYVAMLEQNTFGLLAFQLQGCPEHKYTKNAVVQKLQMPPHHLQTDQLMATVVMVKRTEWSRALIHAWYRTGAHHYTLLDDERAHQEAATFVDHRHDQSMFSCLVKKTLDRPENPHPVIVPDETFFFPDWNQGLRYPFWATRLRE